MVAEDTIAGLLDDVAGTRPGQPFLRDTTGQTLTVGQVAELTRAGTRWLWECGVRPGMIVAWQLRSNVSAVLLMLSLARTAVSQVPIIHLYRRPEVAAAVKAAGADLLIHDQSASSSASPDSAALALPRDFPEQLRARKPDPDRRLTDHRSTDDRRWIFFTSGSTGGPKAVWHTDATLLCASKGFTEHVGLGQHPDERGSIVFPIGHIGGITYVASALLGNYQVLMVPKVTPRLLPQVLAQHRVTVTGASSTLYQMLLHEQLASGRTEPLVPSLRMLIGGGAACPAELHAKVRDRLGIPIVHAYGMTEAPMVCVSLAADSDEQRANSCGPPIAGSQLRIDGTGEIQIRGRNMSPGYVSRRHWTQALTPDGWFRTGDLGYLRSDGRIAVTGRLKDLIIRKGENLSPQEIESALLAHPLVDDVVVIGQPDELRGELVCAVVRRHHDHRDVTLPELCAFLDRRGLMKQKWPERLVVVDEFPLTGLGKVAKLELARVISGGPP